MQHEHHTHKVSQPSVIGHVVFLAVALLILGGLYLYFQSAASVLWGSAGLVLVHLGIGTGVLYLLRGFLMDALRRMHGVQAEPMHTHEAPRTEGLTISWAATYDLLVKSLFLGGEQKVRDAIVSLAHIRAGEKVLDVGCGTGSLAITAALKSEPGAEIHGTDAAPEMIVRAREKAEKAGARVDFQTGLVEAIAFPDDSLDVVMNSFMVHHLPGELKRKAFAEIYRVLKPGGRLLIVDFEPPKRRLTRAVLRMVLGPGMLAIDNSQLPPLLEAAGFVSVKSGNAGHTLTTYFSAQKAG